MSKNTILNLKDGFLAHRGFTIINKRNNHLFITHNGNMGNSIEKSVNPNLKILGFPTVFNLKRMFPVYKEQGSPDYSWYISFTLTYK